MYNIIVRENKSLIENFLGGDLSEKSRKTCGGDCCFKYGVA